MWDADFNQYFHNQVTKQDAPNYRDLIKKPVSIKDMKNRCKRNEYKSSQELMADVQMMKLNAEVYNGGLHSISKLAGDLTNLCERLLERRKDEILNLETLVREINI